MIDQLSKEENAVMGIFKKFKVPCGEGQTRQMIRFNFIKKFNPHEFNETMDSLVKKGYLYENDDKTFFILSKKGSEYISD